jgi:uncharacterized phiE125 gp8 family phage protein
VVVLERRSAFDSSVRSYNATVVCPADVLPIHMEDARSAIRMVSSAHDDELELLIEAAREYIEGRNNITLVSTQYSWVLPDWDQQRAEDGVIRIMLPRGPAQRVDSVDYFDTDDVAVAKDANWFSTNFDLIVDEYMPGIVVQKPNVTLPSISQRDNAITITWTAGFGDDPEDVPSTLRHAIRVLIAHWFEHPEAVITGTISSAIELSLNSLLARYHTGKYIN